MKVSSNWLSDFITWKERDPKVIAERLTACTGEVESIEVQGAHLEGCCVGKVLSVKKHPNADRLSICDVQTDKGVKHVVCGGTNLRQGMRVAFAHVGTVIAGPDGNPFILKEVTIRGEESEGMICSSPELKLTDRFPMTPEQGERPVIDLGDGGDGVGRPLAEYLGLNDVIFHIDNHAITHRPDLFSQVGFARECVALGLATWKKASKGKAVAFPKAALPFELVVEQRKLMPRYCGCALSIAALGETPKWMERRLLAVGFRPITLPIDITNYVTVELGMPLHSFDLADLNGAIHIRAAKEGEKITTLDEVDRILPAGAVVMSDDVGIFDLMGIMGGLRSSTTEKTRQVYLHSPVVDPVAIRNAIIATGHRTEAATIYEKDVPPVLAREGLMRALELFLALVPGATITSRLQEWGTDGSPKPIAFSAKQVEQVLGTAVPEKVAKKILADLGFKVGRGAVTPPLWRIKDVSGPHDLAEEVGRIMGYDRIAPALPRATIEAPPHDPRIDRLRDSLKEQGFLEILPLSLLGPDLLRKCRLDASDAVEVENALGEELSLMQTSTLPRLLEHASQNLLEVADAVRTFTCSHVFHRREGEWLECGILTAERRNLPLAVTPFLAIRQLLVEELQGAGYSVDVRAGAVPPFGHPGRSADLIVNGKAIGLLCELHPAVAATFDLPGRAAITLLDLTRLLALPEKPVIFSPLPQFPAITYDLTVTLTAKKKVAEFLEKVRSSSSLLESISVVDLFEGKQLPKGAYNLTVRCTYRAKDRTLTEEEVKREHAKIEAELGNRE